MFKSVTKSLLEEADCIFSETTIKYTSNGDAVYNKGVKIAVKMRRDKHVFFSEKINIYTVLQKKLD